MTHTHALFADQSQSILAHRMELSGQGRACSGSAEAAQRAVVHVFGEQPLGRICDVASSWFLVPAEANQPGFEAPSENASGNIGWSPPIKPLASRRRVLPVGCATTWTASQDLLETAAVGPPLPSRDRDRMAGVAPKPTFPGTLRTLAPDAKPAVILPGFGGLLTQAGLSRSGRDGRAHCGWRRRGTQAKSLRRCVCALRRWPNYPRSWLIAVSIPGNATRMPICSPRARTRSSSAVNSLVSD